MARKKYNRWCRKCSGEGWLWGYELDDADEDTCNDTMTKYTCDHCRASEIMKSWEWAWLQYDCDFKKGLKAKEGQEYPIELFIDGKGKSYPYYKVLDNSWSPVSRGMGFARACREEVLRQIEGRIWCSELEKSGFYERHKS